MVSLMLEGCSKRYQRYMADDISVRIYLSLGNPRFVIPAEYFHILASIFHSHVWKKWVFGHHLICPLCILYTLEIIGKWLIFEEMQYDKNALKDQSRAFYRRLTSDQLIVYHEIIDVVTNIS